MNGSKMKKYILAIVIYFVTSMGMTAMNSDEITGSWSSILKVQGMQLTIVINIEQTEFGLKATMDSPDQKVFGIPVSSINFENNKLNFEIKNGGISFSGEMKNGKINGIFSQAGYDFDLVFSKGVVEKVAPNRPQEPKKPFPYHSEDVKFTNEKENIKLAGTLTLPKKEGKFPAVILITGSGPQNRDEELLDHKPFLVISDYLTRNGIAVLRYDDRGFAESEGDFSTATSLDFAEDVKSAVQYLKSRKEVDNTKIGLIGHSEGGIIAAIVASEMKDDISFIVQLAGTGIRGDELLLLQQELIFKVSGKPEDEIKSIIGSNKIAFDMIINSTDDKELEKSIRQFVVSEVEKNPELNKNEELKKDYIEMMIRQTLNPWMLNFLRLDPALSLEKVTCPVLSLIGEKDIQVPPNPNLKEIENALKKAGNKHYTIMELPGLNHLFQECETGSIDEYGEIEQTISPKVLDIMTNWIQKQTK